MQKKICVLAGEPSGDDLGKAIIDQLNAIANLADSDAKYDFFGVGGPKMAEANHRSYFDYTKLHVMGIFEILPKFFELRKTINDTAENILRDDPDTVITIDAPDFSKRVVKKLRAKNFSKPILHIVAPSVWAWRPARASVMDKLYDGLLCLLPFEPEYFQPPKLAGAKIKAKFMGHPLADQVCKHRAPSFWQQEKKNLVILPGSRSGEISRILPIFLSSLQNTLKEHPKQLGRVSFVCLPKNKAQISEIYQNHSLYKDLNSIEIIDDAKRREACFDQAHIAFAASGTVTVETALRKIPTIVGYTVNPLTAFLIRRLINKNLKYVSIINILMREAVFPEFIQNDCCVEKIEKQLARFLSPAFSFEPILDRLKKFEILIKHPIGCSSSADTAAQFIKEFLDRE